MLRLSKQQDQLLERCVDLHEMIDNALKHAEPPKRRGGAYLLNNRRR